MHVTDVHFGDEFVFNSVHDFGSMVFQRVISGDDHAARIPPTPNHISAYSVIGGRANGAFIGETGRCGSSNFTNFSTRRMNFLSNLSVRLKGVTLIRNHIIDHGGNPFGDNSIVKNGALFGV